MNIRNTLIVCLFFCSIIPFFGQTPSLKIMTYNIRNGIGMDRITDYTRTADVISKYQPDIIAIQEVDSITNRSNQKFVLKEIADLMNMFYYFAPAIDFDGGKYGIGVLSRETPIQTYAINLPGREEARAFIVVEFENYYLLCTHLSLTPEDQLVSINIINNVIGNLNKPVFIAGDFNAVPDSPTIDELNKKWTILSPIGGKTYPADIPTEPIDYIAIDRISAKKIETIDSFVAEEPLASDHRPIVVEVVWK